MTTPTLKLCPTAPLQCNKNYDLEERFEKKLKNVNSFNTSIKNIKEMISSFKVKNRKSK